jgi:hypothetical protein
MELILPCRSVLLPAEVVRRRLASSLMVRLPWHADVQCEGVHTLCTYPRRGTAPAGARSDPRWPMDTASFSTPFVGPLVTAWACFTGKYPAIAESLPHDTGPAGLSRRRALRGVQLDGITSFALIQNAADRRGGADLVFFVFDLLHLDGLDLMPLPLGDRKARLAVPLDVAPPRSTRFGAPLVLSRFIGFGLSSSSRSNIWPGPRTGSCARSSMRGYARTSRRMTSCVRACRSEHRSAQRIFEQSPSGRVPACARTLIRAVSSLPLNRYPHRLACSPN